MEVTDYESVQWYGIVRVAGGQELERVREKNLGRAFSLLGAD